MDYRDFLLAAYEQNHPTSSEAFLDAIEGMIGAGPLFDLHRLMCKKYGPPKLGTSRVSYLSKTVVFKVPVSENGFRCNDWEGSIVSLGDATPIARARLHPNSEIPIVVMERVEEVSLEQICERLGHIPDFVYAIDMAQVGFTRAGKLVAFDYVD